MFKNLVTKHPMLGSSANPEKLSLTIVNAVPLIVAVVAYFGVTIDANNLTELINQLIIIVTAVGSAIGLARKMYYAVKK